MKVTSIIPNLICVLILHLSALRTQGQSSWEFKTNVNVGANLFLTNIFDKAGSNGYKFPGTRIYVAMGASAQKGRLMLNYGPSFSIYTKTIGSNLNKFVDDFQIDFTNSISIGYGSKERTGYSKQIRTLHNGDYYNIVFNNKFLGFLTTNIILNNHKRHQVVGAINLSYDHVSINYYNDGPPFNSIGLGDGFDRYWTGGGHIIYHGSRNQNIIEFSYDQFTGYAPLLYELSNILGINVPIYESETGEQKTILRNYNTSAYHVKVNGGRYFNFDAGVIGNLASKNGRYFGIQDIIHLKGRLSLHPNNDRNRFFIGGSFKNNWNVKL